MFGLMRAKKCAMSVPEREVRRLHYCGTCKTIGAVYGQKARLLLNHDIVFLAELLGALAKENTSNWQKSYQAYNCLSLPDKSAMPAALTFASTANVILTKFKIADHLADSSARRYRYADRLFTAEFQKAESLLREWDFPLAEVEKILAGQTAVETASIGKKSHRVLEDCAAPTAQTTAIFFAEGVRLIGQADWQKAADKLGYAFGKLIYLLDALEDYEKDCRENQFNAIRAAFALSENKLPEKIERKVMSMLRKLESEVIASLDKLPLEEAQKELFTARLTQNLQRKLAPGLSILAAKNTCRPKHNPSFAQRRQKALGITRQLTASLQKNWSLPLIFAAVFTIALLSPVHAKQAKSWQECAGLSFNLMFLGAIIGSVFVSARSVLMQEGQANPGTVPPPSNKSRKGKMRSKPDNTGWSCCCAGWFGDCDCDCCDCLDGCDCCCECGDCCDC